MSIRTILVVFLALVFSGMAAVVISQALTKPDQPAADREKDKPPVVSTHEYKTLAVAKVHIKPGTKFSKEMVIMRREPLTKENKENLPPENEWVTSMEDLVESMSKSNLRQGNYIQKSDVGGKGDVGLAALIAMPKPVVDKKTGQPILDEKGQPMVIKRRAYPIEGKSLSTLVAGFVRPDDHVDVLLTLATDRATVGQETGGASTVTLLRDVRVLAVDKSVQPQNTGDPVEASKEMLKSVVLEVTPEDAEILALGQQKGSLQLLLRNAKEEEVEEPNKVKDPDDVRRKDLVQILGGGKKKEINKKAEDVGIRIIKGGTEFPLYAP